MQVTEQEKSMLSQVGREHGLWDSDAPAALLARGSENTTFAVGDVIVRRSDARDALAREVTLLRALASATTVPVPVPLVHDPERGLLAYRRLPGTPLIHRAERGSASVAPALIEVLSALRALETAALLPLDPVANEAWHDEARQAFPIIEAHLTREQAASVRDFLSQDPPATRADAVPQHNDLGAEHILIDADGDVTGIVDWTDAARADPARDIGSIYRDLGGGTAFRVGGALGHAITADEKARVRFHARCRWIEDVVFGLQEPVRREVYLRNAALTFEHTFRT